MALKVSTSTHGQAQMHQSLHHPNVVTLFSCFGDPGAYVYLSEYCHGGNLRDYLENLGRPGLDHNELKSLVRSMASALLYLQGKSIIHRSVEPRNILISTTSLFKLHNFEDAVYFGERLQNPCKNTTPYTAPELVAREPYSYSADAWSVGCVFMAACAGPVSVELLAEKVEDVQLPEESFDRFQVLLRNILQRPSDGSVAEEILLVDPLKQDVQIHAPPSRAAVCQAKLTKPRQEFPISELPEPHNTIYLEALALLEEIKQRTPMLTLYMIDGKCTMMCNSPLPDIEILLRVTPPTQSLSSRAMFRIRLFRRLQRLEFAQRTSNENSSEWLKRIVPSTDNYPFVQTADWNSLDDLEKRGIQILKKFVLVCDSALELGLHSIESADDPSDVVDTLNEDSTFDSDFTPNFVPDLASSLPPRPLRKHKT
ncbi:hypothetical protein H1R20_g1948, partial [Candolleomyces eurysporus]